MFAVYLAGVYRSLIGGGKKQQTNGVAYDEDGIEIDDMDLDEETATFDPAVVMRFKSAAAFLPQVLNRLPKDDIMQFYALYKQALLGDAKPADRPGLMDVKGRTKFDAWAELTEMPRETAMKTYAAKMDYMELGWDPTMAAGVQQGFGVRPSRLTRQSESAEASVSAHLTPPEREGLLWFVAVKADDLPTVLDIHKRRPELLDQPDQHLGMTALQWAIDSGADKVIHFLIENRANVNATDPEGNTPLHFAAYCHRLPAAERLITAGADRSLRNRDGHTPADACDDPILKTLLRPPTSR